MRLGKLFVVQATNDGLSGRLRARFDEIEQAVLTRVYSISPDPVADPEYLDGLRAAVPAAIEYGISSIERGTRRLPPIPPPLLSQARLAARHFVSVDKVIRGYLAGYAVLGDFVAEETERVPHLQRLPHRTIFRSQAVGLERILAEIAEEYTREQHKAVSSRRDRRAALVKCVLAGELIDTSELSYGFDGHHIGVVVKSDRASESIRRLANALDGRLLLVQPYHDVAWAWVGRRGKGFDREEIDRAAAAVWPPSVPLALGLSGEGLVGWRLTHQQAQAAIPHAGTSLPSVVHYADVALQVSLSRDELLTVSLRALYLDPLSQERDGGLTLRETLRAYFAANRNGASAAAALGVSRQTVTNRLRTVEEKIGRPITSCASALEMALESLHQADRPRSHGAR